LENEMRSLAQFNPLMNYLIGSAVVLACLGLGLAAYLKHTDLRRRRPPARLPRKGRGKRGRVSK
jgi:hypothetical protein